MTLLKASLFTALVLASASAAFADGPSFGKGEYTTEGEGQCFTPNIMDCYEDTSHPDPVTTWDVCLRMAKPGDPYRWKNKFGKCLGSDGRYAG